MWVLAIELALKLLGWLLDRGAVSKEQKKAFLSFVSAYDEMGNNSLRHHDEVKKQLDDLQKSDHSNSAS